MTPRRVVGNISIQRTTNQRTQLSRGGDALWIMSRRTDVAICHTAVHNKLIQYISTIRIRAVTPFCPIRFIAAVRGGDLGHGRTGQTGIIVPAVEVLTCLRHICRQRSACAVCVAGHITGVDRTTVRVERNRVVVYLKRSRDRSVCVQHMNRSVGERVSVDRERSDAVTAVGFSGDGQFTGMCQAVEVTSCIIFGTIICAVMVCVLHFDLSVCRCSYTRVVRDHTVHMRIAVERAVVVHRIATYTAGGAVENDRLIDC